MPFQPFKFLVVPGVKRRIELDFLRGIAIVMVMGNHFLLPATSIPVLDAISGWFKRCGGFGVDLFFVLSGFLVGGLLLREYGETGSIRPARFLLRRGLKIWPAFYFLLIVQALVRSHPLNTFLWQNAFHVQNYFGTSIRQTWSLAIEEHFYLALAFMLAWLAARSARPERLLLVMALLCLTSAGLRTESVLAGHLDGAFRWTQNRLDSLMFGVIIATLFHLKPEWYARVARQRTLLAAGAVVTFVFLSYAAPNLVLMRTVGFIICYVGFGAFLILVYEHSGRLREWFGYRFLAWVGIYSYGIYLWHTITLAPAGKLALKLSPALRFPVVVLFEFVVAVVVGVVLTHAVEWPFLRWREKHFGKQRNPTQQPLAMASSTS